MPKIVDHDAYRQEIIATAIQLFVAQGYAGLGMRELAKALGISKSALYHYYPSKEALFGDVVESVVQSTVDELATPRAEATPFVEQFDGFVDYVLAHENGFAQEFLILTEYARLGKDAESAAQMVSGTDRYVTAIATFLGIAIEEAQAVYFQINGVLLQRLIDGGRTDLGDKLQWLRATLAAKYDQGGLT